MVFNADNLTAAVSVGCTKLSWSNGAVWTQTQPNSAVERVHIVFMTHLDVGFTLLARDVCDQYFDVHFPRGIALSQELRALGGPAQYAVTTHPWLVQEYFDSAANCSHTTRNASAAALMEDAIARGDVRWHGKPMNNFAELEDGPWFDMSLTMSRNLNKRFNTSWGALAAKSTDVPGFSKSAIPRFSAAGIRMLHMGELCSGWRFALQCWLAHTPVTPQATTLLAARPSSLLRSCGCTKKLAQICLRSSTTSAFVCVPHPRNWCWCIAHPPHTPTPASATDP